MTTSPTGTDTGAGWQNLQPNTITTIHSSGTFDTAPQSTVMGTAIDPSEAASVASTVAIRPAPQIATDRLIAPQRGSIDTASSSTDVFDSHCIDSGRGTTDGGKGYGNSNGNR